MPTTREDIQRWLQEAKTTGASHLLVVCDTYDWSDYPVRVMPGEDVHKRAAENNGPNMTKLMEVYKVSMDWESQLNEHRSFNY
jgi:hypothetical protein